VVFIKKISTIKKMRRRVRTEEEEGLVPIAPQPDVKND
jgi:hypothetical protein